MRCMHCLSAFSVSIGSSDSAIDLYLQCSSPALDESGSVTPKFGRAGVSWTNRQRTNRQLPL
jgi:hypothetical protein